MILPLALTMAAGHAASPQTADAAIKTDPAVRIKPHTDTAGRYTQKEKDKELAAAADHIEQINLNARSCAGKEPCASTMKRASDAAQRNYERIKGLKVSPPSESPRPRP